MIYEVELNISNKIQPSYISVCNRLRFNSLCLIVDYLLQPFFQYRDYLLGRDCRIFIQVEVG